MPDDNSIRPNETIVDPKELYKTDKPLYITPPHVKIKPAYKKTEEGKWIASEARICVEIGYTCHECKSLHKMHQDAFNLPETEVKFPALKECDCCGEMLNVSTRPRTVSRWKALAAASEMLKDRDIEQVINEEQSRGDRRPDRKPKQRKKPMPLMKPWLYGYQ